MTMWVVPDGSNGDAFRPGVQVRKRLLRRIERGEVCGRIKADGSPCLGTPRANGQRCWRCLGDSSPPVGNSSAETHGASPKVPSKLLQFYQSVMSDADGALLAEVWEETATLEDVAAMLRARIATLQGRYRDCLVKDDDFQRGMLLLSNELRRTLETHSRMQLNRAALDKLQGGNFGEDEYDPVTNTLRSERTEADE